MHVDVAVTPAAARPVAVGIVVDPMRATSTNGTRTIVKPARTCDYVPIGSLLDLDAVTAAARGAGGDAVVPCAGSRGSFALDDADCTGPILDGPPA